MAPRARRKDGGLVAVLLITRSRPGPKLVFHYPEVSNADAGADRRDRYDSDPDSDGEYQSSSGAAVAKDLPNVANLQLNHDVDSAWPEKVLGYTYESLEKLLSPGRWCDQVKFEVCANGITFLGHPVYVPADGNWSELRKEREALGASETAAASYEEYHMYLEPTPRATMPPESLPHRDFTHISGSLDSQTAQVLGSSAESNSTASGRSPDNINMFHVVFASRMTGAGSQEEAKTMYREVASNLSKALTYCQQQSNYVGVESRKILAMRAKAKQQQISTSRLWTQIAETSELAWALREIYTRISANEVASIRLNGMKMSLQIPESQHGSGFDLNPLSGVILLESKDALLQQLSQLDASLLAHFVRELTPTKSLQKHSINLGVPIRDILYLAYHLIRWRKAKAIAPLHQRNTYVVHPKARVDQLPQVENEYSRAFPTLPSLPNMMKVLSGKPIKFGLLIPSRDHRMVYMEILGFLVRHDLVAQLKTCGWLRLPREIGNAAVAHPDPNRRPMSVRSLLSPHIGPVDADDDASVSSERTAIAATTAAHSKSSRRPSIVPPLPPPSSGFGSVERNHDCAGAVIITNPREPTEEGASLIAAATASLGSAAGELRTSFPTVLLPYLDGEHTFEEIAAREGLKRAKVEEWLETLERKDWLLTVRCL